MPKIKSKETVDIIDDDGYIVIHNKKEYRRFNSGGYRNTYIHGDLILKIDIDPKSRSECLKEYNFYTKILKPQDKKFFAKLVAFGHVTNKIYYTIQKHYTPCERKLSKKQFLNMMQSLKNSL
jgi:hypothetical protein